MVQDYVSYKRNKGEGSVLRNTPWGFVRKIKPKFITLT